MILQFTLHVKMIIIQLLNIVYQKIMKKKHPFFMYVKTAILQLLNFLFQKVQIQKNNR